MHNDTIFCHVEKKASPESRPSLADDEELSYYFLFVLFILQRGLPKKECPIPVQARIIKIQKVGYMMYHSQEWGFTTEGEGILRVVENN